MGRGGQNYNIQLNLKHKSKQFDLISDETFKSNVKALLQASKKGQVAAQKNYERNQIDPFAYFMISSLESLNFNNWLKIERARQTGKSIENAVGDFHQSMLSSFKGWRDLGKGGKLDIVNDDKKIVAEIKNKWNTCNANGKKSIYEDLRTALKGEYKGYTGYFVYIIPPVPGKKRK